MSSYFMGKPSEKEAEPAAAAEPVPDHTQVLHPQPVPDIRMRAPEVAPAPGQVVIGYRVVNPKSGKKMAAGVAGGTALGICSVLILPCCLPCAIAACVVPALQGRLYQVPVYGWPGEAPAVAKMAAPGQPEAGAAAVPIGVAVVPVAEAQDGVTVAPAVAAPNDVVASAAVAPAAEAPPMATSQTLV